MIVFLTIKFALFLHSIGFGTKNYISDLQVKGCLQIKDDKNEEDSACSNLISVTVEQRKRF
jgi:hypothetical protein